ncbi:MAG: PASTA domain-containing protein [Nitrospirae bacterium]|nr:PASTA domain-containing protein [Nitrospirota bacterium]
MNSFLRVSLFFVLFVVFGLTFGFLTFKILSFSRTVEVPSIMNMTVIEADKVLGKAGLDLKIEGEDFDSVIPLGKIVRQDVPPGKTVKEKRAIRVVISKGPKVLSIPLLVNETLQNAESILVQKGLRIGKVINVHSDGIEKGLVVAQRPEPDDKLTDVITVLVSAGPHDQTYYCPDFQGRQIEDVREVAQKMGLEIETQGTGSIVKNQRPKPGAVIKNSEKLYLEMKEVTTP